LEITLNRKHSNRYGVRLFERQYRMSYSMNVKQTENEILTDFILDYSDHLLTPAEERSFRDFMAMYDDTRKSAKSGRSTASLLKKLPEIRAKEGFEQRMAAAFALEIEDETRQANIKNCNNKELIN